MERFTGDPVGMVTCMDVRGEVTEKGLLPIMIESLNANDKLSCDEAPNPNFSAFMLSKQCWEEVGEMDEVFAPAYFEDNDYHYRMKVLGIPAIVLPTAMFYHYGSRTQNEATSLPIVNGSMFENNRASYAKKWGGVPGSETFKSPYNDESKSVKLTKQNG